MSDSSVTRYLELDETAYENTIRLLIRRVHDAAKGKEPAASDEALHQFFTVALTKGANFLKIGFEDLAVKDAKDLALAASSLPDKDSITAENRQDFAKAAKRRTESAQWNDIFPDGQNDIILPLKGDAKTINQQVNDLLQAHNKEAEIAYKEAKRQQDMLTSGDEQQIAAYIEAHNRKAEALNRSAPDGQASGGIFRQEIRRNENPKDPAIVEIRNSDTNVWRASRQLQHIAGKAIEQTRLRIHPDDPNKLQSALPYDPDRPEDPTIPREADWKDAIRLGKFLEERMEWSLLDDFDLEKSSVTCMVTYSAASYFIELKPTILPSVSSQRLTHPNSPMENFGRMILPPAATTRDSSTEQSFAPKYNVVPPGPGRA